MHILSALLFAISANIDNFIVGIAYGIKKVKISILSNVIIAAITYIGTFLSMAMGKIVCKFLNENTANILGSSILIGLGIYCIISPLIKKNKQSNHHTIDGECSSFRHCEEIVEDAENGYIEQLPKLGIKESICIAIALTLNNMAIGISASITGLSIFFTSTCTFVFSILALLGGYILGKTYLSNKVGKWGSVVTGSLIIIMVIY